MTTPLYCYSSYGRMNLPCLETIQSSYSKHVHLGAKRFSQSLQYITQCNSKSHITEIKYKMFRLKEQKNAISQGTEFHLGQEFMTSGGKFYSVSCQSSALSSTFFKAATHERLVHRKRTLCSITWRVWKNENAWTCSFPPITIKFLGTQNISGL